MSREIANPLQALIQKAAETSPKHTGEVERHAARATWAASGTALILADVSGSMSESAGTRSKYDLLREALDQAARPGDDIVAFSSTARRIDSPQHLPYPSGGTALHLALAEAVATQPGVTLVISDGQPDDADAALTEAAKLRGLVNVVYCGPDDDHEAIAFMRRLAAQGGGRCYVHDLRHVRAALGPVIRGALEAPR